MVQSAGIYPARPSTRLILRDFSRRISHGALVIRAFAQVTTRDSDYESRLKWPIGGASGEASLRAFRFIRPCSGCSFQIPNPIIASNRL
jgi:hypothetical protein